MRALAAAALCASLTSALALGQDAAITDEIIVRGGAFEALRLEIRRAEDDVYSRFNEINSTDLYDFHCYERAEVGTHIKRRLCVTNAWRANSTTSAEATVRGLQNGTLGGTQGNVGVVGGGTGVSQAARAKQLATERRAVEEMDQLARTDPALGAAIRRLGQAYQAEELMAGNRSDATPSREVTPAEGLPPGAQHLFEVRVGAAAWSHPLASRTFTITAVTGKIRDMRLDCDKADKQLDYEEDVDWTVPDAWGKCTLSVGARRNTTFALYELQ